MNNKENKPLILVLEELEDKILKLVNESGIPAFYLHYIFENIDNDLQKIKVKELEIATQSFNESKNKTEGVKENDWI